ncbi:MAG: hypothetical protein RR595_05915 [Lysinibacillus sp.]
MKTITRIFLSAFALIICVGIIDIFIPEGFMEYLSITIIVWGFVYYNDKKSKASRTSKK